MMERKILWIACSVPCKRISHAGGQTFRYYFFHIANDHRFEVKLIGCDDGMTDDEIKNDLVGIDYRIVHKGVSKLKKVINLESQFNPWNRYAGILSNYYANEIWKYAKEFKEKGYEPDVIILEWTGIVLMVPKLRKLFPKTAFVASEHDVTFVGYKRRSEYFKGLRGLVWSSKYKWERKLELRALGFCDLVFTHNPDNMVLLEEEGVNFNVLQWLIPYFNNMSNCKRHSNGKDILFFGAMARAENYLSAIWFIENVMLKLDDLDIRFVVLGSNPPEQLRRYESRRIHITGFADSIVPYFESSICLVAPLVLGAGIKVKIIEGLSSGIPVITNAVGIEGIPAHKSREYIHCETANEYEDAIRSAYNGKLEKVGEIGKAFIQKTYNLEESLDNYIQKIISLERNSK